MIYRAGEWTCDSLVAESGINTTTGRTTFSISLTPGRNISIGMWNFQNILSKGYFIKWFYSFLSKVKNVARRTAVLRFLSQNSVFWPHPLSSAIPRLILATGRWQFENILKKSCSFQRYHHISYRAKSLTTRASVSFFFAQAVYFCMTAA